MVLKIIQQHLVTSFRNLFLLIFQTCLFLFLLVFELVKDHLLVLNISTEFSLFRFRLSSNSRLESHFAK